METYTPVHYSEGRCAGLQFKPASRLLRGIKKTGQIGAYAGIAVGVTAGVVVVTPIALGALPQLHSCSDDLSSLMPDFSRLPPRPSPAVGIPTLAIGLPIYGAYKIVS
jgi:hypothetical protein